MVTDVRKIARARINTKCIIQGDAKLYYVAERHDWIAVYQDKNVFLVTDQESFDELDHLVEGTRTLAEVVMGIQ